jgi:peptide/nickel transport system substrate-binding protein
VDAAADAGPPAPGGSLTFATDIESPCWDPHQSPADVTALVQRNVFDSLVSEDRNGTFHPWLAASWTIAPDGKSYTFKLRQDVKFHDGATFDAAAVKANFDHIVDPATKSQYAASLLGPYTGTTVVDPYTARVEFSAPFRPFLQAASTPYLGFYSPTALAAHKDSLCGDSSAWVGTGPFKAASYTKTQRIEFNRNADYRWGPADVEHKDAPYLDRLSIRFLPDNAVRVGALNSGEVDMIGALPPVDVAAVKANPALQFIRQDAAGGNYLLFLNVTRPALSDVRVRQAILAAVDLDALIKSVYFGQYNRPWGPISPVTPFYEPAVEHSWGFDQAKANSLLDAAGGPGATRRATAPATAGGSR